MRHTSLLPLFHIINVAIGPRGSPSRVDTAHAPMRFLNRSSSSRLTRPHHILEVARLGFQLVDEHLQLLAALLDLAGDDGLRELGAKRRVIVRSPGRPELAICAPSKHVRNALVEVSCIWVCIFSPPPVVYSASRIPPGPLGTGPFMGLVVWGVRWGLGVWGRGLRGLVLTGHGALAWALGCWRRTLRAVVFRIVIFPSVLLSSGGGGFKG